MNSSVRRHGTSLSRQLGLTERLLASPATKRLIAAVDDGLDRLEAELVTSLRSTDALVDSTSRYLLEAGGKRVRPMLLFLTAQLGDGTTTEVIDAAQGIEITHLGSLYHDDVMDESDRRRGVPSAHRVWGNSVAILAGDLLFSKASQLMSALGDRASALQSETFERLVLGQLHETVGPAEGEDREQHYIQVLADKTGSLIAAAARAGVIFSNAPREFETPVLEYGERIGIAFQLADDVLDLSADPAVTGKVPGTDLRAGVDTLPTIRLRRLADAGDADAAALVARIDDADADDAAFADTVAVLRDHEVTRSALADARRWSDEAVRALDPLPAGAVKDALVRFAGTIVDRSS
ncbi:polyprenyl synthetase family protein [Mycetocola reblochoni]|uniref:Octaprenyl-diphosphate synthase / Dimethylallyltransferase / Geranylgeranyl pyrophosphate synthetase n=2 Tax=Mycetocola reblochoni TaxID=331618 RepID=A0A1R4IX76_9MICO|nr:polyprenyl synthetase family protein [Mycetocola reblochoni]RLP70922.1 polyprenyl synthetase family protein [Mycetocola reblochoni]SJN24511.1 Octaprenyl-diphosphate synthase / Dimethylallyltransferase / Geranylgeranyl pyrophosphate synthetase [Mycetocola reblochoni REB411]